MRGTILIPRQTNRRWNGGAIALLIVLGAVLAFVIHQRHPELNLVEAKLTGHWYAIGADVEAPSRWITVVAFQRDRLLSLDGKRFERRDVDGRSEWEGPMPDPADRMTGRWFLNADGAGQWTLDKVDPLMPWERVRILVLERRWVRQSPDVVPVRVTFKGTDELVIEIVTTSAVLLAVRVPDDFTLPDGPLEPDEVLAWWGRKQSDAKKIEAH